MQLNFLVKIGAVCLIISTIFFLAFKTSINLNQFIHNPNIQITEFKTDKSTYSSYEEMKIFVKLKSSEDLENVNVKVWGIKPRNYAHINDSKTVSLKKGENEIVFNAKTPYCTSGCGGVYPGPYDLFLEVWFNGEIVASATSTINLVKG